MKMTLPGLKSFSAKKVHQITKIETSLVFLTQFVRRKFQVIHFFFRDCTLINSTIFLLKEVLMSSEFIPHPSLS